MVRILALPLTASLLLVAQPSAVGIDAGGLPPAVSMALARDPSEDVVARGRVEPRDGVIAVSGPPESLSTVAIIDKLLVEQGSVVAVGDVLAVLNGYDLSRADLEVAKASLQVSRLQRAQLQAGIGKIAEIAGQTNALAARRAELVRAEKDWNRAAALVERNAASVQLLDAQKAALDRITQEVEQAQNTIKALSEVRPVDDALAAGQIAVAEASVAKAQAQTERLQIRARAPGTVLSIQTRGGEVVGAEGILRLADLGKLVVIAEVDQTQIQRVRVGAAATVEGPLWPAPVTARVTRIGNEVYRQKRPSSDILVGRDARIVEVELTPQSTLPPIIGAEVSVRLAAPTAER